MSSVALSVICLFFFFFQAEDGIRDLTVTGVQTCALPISAALPLMHVGSHVRYRNDADWAARKKIVIFGDSSSNIGGDVLTGMLAESVRSEERRVGKECRSRWSPYH